MENEGPRSQDSSPTIRATIAVALLLGVIGVFFAWRFSLRPAATIEVLMERAYDAQAEGKLHVAELAAAEALNRESGRADAAMLAARCAAEQGRFSEAIEYLHAAEPDDPAARFSLLLMAADWNHHRLKHLQAAEEDYRRALKIQPDSVEANTGLATLLGACSRRREAMPCVLRIIRAGQATDLLMLLAREGGIINDDGLLKDAHERWPDDPWPLLGLAWHESEAGRDDESNTLLRAALEMPTGGAAISAAMIRQRLKVKDDRGLAEELSRSTIGIEAFPEFWQGQAHLAEGAGNLAGAVDAQIRAARIAPESKAVELELIRLLSAAGRSAESGPIVAYLRTLQTLEEVQNRVLFTEPPTSAAPFVELAQAYANAGRLWESFGWLQLAAKMDSRSTEIQQRLESAREATRDLPLSLVVDAANPALKLSLSNPSEELPIAPAPVTSEERAVDGSQISFREEAAEAGLKFHYFNGTEGKPSRRMFEFSGGGVAVVDFDRDAWPDVFFTQGCLWPMGSAARGYVDQLFRNRAGRRFANVSSAAAIDEHGFGQGCTVGDFNSDGFPDLYVANIGLNQLWVNNGDGTLSDVTALSGLGGETWTTSCLMADISGDGHPDLYDVTYVTAPDVYDRVCPHADGQPGMCMPFEFDSLPDRIWLNDGEGHFSNATSQLLGEAPLGKGLGIAAFDSAGDGRLSVVVANDTTPNHFLVPVSKPGEPVRLEDQAIISGLAFNADGKATGCMGIAVGDVNADSRMDLSITNFFNEANTLFLSREDGTFEDGTRRMGLYEATLGTLGFGTQFLDADLDGLLDLFLTNGHIDDLREEGKPYAMPPQLFRFEGDRFAEVAASQLGPYFEQQWLGRPAVRLDWNGDGREDLAVGHLESESALLTNTTPDAGNSLRLRLFGRTSARDAIGTTVEARIGERRIVRQLTAGDGYQSSNERAVVVGAGTADRIEELTVRWPSGETQSFRDIAVPASRLLCEGSPLMTEAGRE